MKIIWDIKKVIFKKNFIKLKMSLAALDKI